MTPEAVVDLGYRALNTALWCAMPILLVGMVVGLLIAVATGTGSMLLGYPFMTTHTAHLTLPVLGELHIASAMAFDLGVFCVVVGSTLLILTALAHQSIRGHGPAPDAAQQEGDAWK